jgi:hypothetical protein
VNIIDQRILDRIKNLLLLFPVFLTSCTAKNMDPGDYFKSLWWDVKMNQREAGEELITDPARVWRKLRCDNRPLPYLQIDDNEVIPLRLTAGEKINHHLVYSLCPAKPSEVVSARLSRSILYKGDIIFNDVIDNYELKPGRWSVDAFVKVAEQAQPGVYSLQLTLSNGNLDIAVDTGFVVFQEDEEEAE